MINLFGLLNMGKDALSAQQQALDVTSNNISNANTPGYSRQRAIMGTNPPLATTFGTYDQSGQAGTGVQVEYVQRIRDAYLDQSVRANTQSLNNWQSQEQALSQVQSIFGDMGDNNDNVSSDLNQFWSSWQQLSQDPTSTAYRMDVVQKGQNVADTLNHIYTNLKSLRSSIDSGLDADVQQINTIADKIAKLNTQIMQVEAGGEHANDLRDQRDVLVSQLSAYGDFDVSEDAKGGYVISLNEANLVQDGTTMQLATRTRQDVDGTTVHDIYWASTGIKAIFDSGSIGGTLIARDQIIPKYMAQISKFSQDLNDAVNKQQTAGTMLNGLAATNNPFFQYTANTLTVLISNKSLDTIAAARAGQGGGDNGNATAMADLGDKINAQYVATVSDYGQAEKNAQMYVTMKTSINDQLTQQQNSVSGVSLDEETANMVKYQQAYNAAAKMITIIDDMLSAVLNMGVTK